MEHADVDKWLQDHIPHRIRVMLASTAELQQLRPGQQPTCGDSVVMRCWTDAIWEGRLSALRWLCEFLGISGDSDGNPTPKYKRHPETDIDIEDLPDGLRLDPATPEAAILAAAWKGATQGSVHPTHNSSHPPVDDPERILAFNVIKSHLSATIYKNHPDWIKRWVLQPPPPSKR